MSMFIVEYITSYRFISLVLIFLFILVVLCGVTPLFSCHLSMTLVILAFLALIFVRIPLKSVFNNPFWVIGVYMSLVTCTCKIVSILPYFTFYLSLCLTYLLTRLLESHLIFFLFSILK